MDDDEAITRLSAIATPSRLAILRLLAREAPSDGMKSGEIAAKLDVVQNTISTQLLVLSNARLVRYRRQGRTILYRVDFDALKELIDFIARECGAGKIG
jgi:DNA-binding transcriptional ArsR family regulator